MSNIAVDTSAIVETMIEGPEAQAVLDTMNAAEIVFVTSVARVEAAFVMMGRFGWERTQFEQAWKKLGVKEIPVGPAEATSAINAFEAWGKGRGTAGLNFGDCFSYALATSGNLPLLFVGNDFARTDIAKA
jgi:ribonuclease VapC